MKKLQMLPDAEGPDLGIVREFEDKHAEAILAAQKQPGFVPTWKAVNKNIATTAGYELPTTLSNPTPDAAQPTE